MATCSFVERIHGACQGVRIGDAFGRLPEGRTRAQILALTEGEGVRSYEVPGIPRPLFDGPGGVPGDTTDDWAQTEMVIDSLCDNRGFDLADIARRHVAASDWPHGWGGTTRAAIAAIKAGRPPSVPPPRPDPGEGAGNGPAMKVMPLAWLHALRAVRGGFSAWDGEALRALCDDVVALSFMTHGDPLSAIAAAVLAEIGAHLVLGSCTAAPTYEGNDEARNLVDGIGRRLRKREHPVFAAMDAYGEGSQLGERLCGRICPEDLQVFLEHLLWAVRLPAISGTNGKVLNRKYLASSDDVEIFAGRFVDPFTEKMGFCRSVHSVAAAIAVFVRHSSNGDAAAHVAVNMGGDTDTVASMALALVGANCGTYRLPRLLLDARPDLRDRVASCADRFCAVFRVPGFRIPGAPPSGSVIV